MLSHFPSTALGSFYESLDAVRQHFTARGNKNTLTLQEPIMSSTKFGFETTGIDVVKAFPFQVKDKTFVVTGTSAGGSGAETAISLAHAQPAHLFLLARSLTKTQPVIDAISSLSPSTQTHFIETHTGDLDSIRHAAAQINATLGDGEIAALINSAGGLTREYATSKEGVEMTLVSNYLGHWELTSHLMYGGKVKREEMRVINVASNGHGMCAFDPDDYNFKVCCTHNSPQPSSSTNIPSLPHPQLLKTNKQFFPSQNGTNYHHWAAYGAAKSASMLFSLSLSHPPHNLTSFSLHPGFILNTGATTGMDASEGQVCDEVAQRYSGNRFVPSAPKNAQQGCATGLRAALEPDDGWVKTANGKYLEDCEVGEAYAYAKDEKVAERLWRLSEGWVGHRFEEPLGKKE